MAAPKLRKCKTCTFKGTAILYSDNISWSEQGSELTARGDGAAAMQFAAVEGISHEITVTAKEGPATVHDANLRIGANGSLVGVLLEQAAGQGSAGADKTHTWANATLVGVSPGAPLDGLPSIQYRFRAVATSGDPADILAVT